MRWDGNSWQGVGGFVGSVLTMVKMNGDLYVAGSNIKVNGIDAGNIARGDGTAWSSLGEGTDKRVNALAVSGTDLYVGGFFDRAGGTAAENYMYHVSRRDGSTRNRLRTQSEIGVGTTVYSLAVHGTDLYVGGTFGSVSGVTVNGITQWDGTGWSPLGSGLNNTPFTMLVDGDVQIGGSLGGQAGQPLELAVNGLRAMRFEDNGDSIDISSVPDGAPTVIGGSPANFVASGVVGATIVGGGATEFNQVAAPNSVLADYGSVLGGLDNIAGGFAATAMGQSTRASGESATAMGFSTSASGDYSTAMGRKAKANHAGTFVWADSQNAVLGLYSPNSGNWGSAVVLGETAFLAGTTSGSGSHLRFTFGTDANYAANDAQMRIEPNGDVRADGAFIGGGADVAESFDVEGNHTDYEPGGVLAISTESDGHLVKSTESYSTLVAGVHATKPGVLLTDRGIEADLSGQVPLGGGGVIPHKFCLEGGPIQRGDLLVSSSKPGHAMKGHPNLIRVGTENLFPETE